MLNTDRHDIPEGFVKGLLLLLFRIRTSVPAELGFCEGMNIQVFWSLWELSSFYNCIESILCMSQSSFHFLSFYSSLCDPDMTFMTELNKTNETKRKRTKIYSSRYQKWHRRLQKPKNICTS